jgi:hypothetical protein
MEELKMALTRAPILVKITYGEDSGEIILAMDASSVGWGAVLMQLNEKGLWHLSWYESGLWSKAETSYDAMKRECKAVVKALWKVKY